MSNDVVNEKNKSVSQQLSDMRAAIDGGVYDRSFKILCPQRDISECRARYSGLISLFEEQYINGAAADAAGSVVLISAPGRTEICGNHTDHQHGTVLAAAIDLDVICVAAANHSNKICIKSVGHPEDVIDLDDLGRKDGERGQAAALIRGLAARFTERGVKIGGFDAYTTSHVLVGSGLSSSAAFEVVVGTTMNALFDGGFSPLEIAMAGQFAENYYFGKPSGLMDQTASSVGGFVKIDFADPANPLLEPIRYDPAAHGLFLCVVNTKGNHADLIGEYASIPGEMRAIASYFNKSFLREVDEDAFYGRLAEIRGKLRVRTGDNFAADRAITRAMHFFRENKLVSLAADALKAEDTKLFLECVNRSGQSSFNYLQNIFTVTEPGEQGLTIALALSDSILGGNGGAWRVHGGGFAGTIMAFVPAGLLEKYTSSLEAVFGEGSCITLSIRKFGGVAVTPDLA